MHLPKVVTKRQKRVGQGAGSGKGFHTSGRGQKGQKSRGKVGVLFEGTKMKKSLIRRLPLKRGKAKFQGYPKPFAVSIDLLNVFSSGAEITVESLIKAGLVSDKAKKIGVKILGGEKLTKKLTVTVPTSQSAARQIEVAGGTITK